MSHLQALQPPTWARARGFANGVKARGTLVFTAGMIGWNAQQQFETDDFVAQTKQALYNVLAVVQEAGGRAEDIVRLTWFITDREAYLAHQQELGAAYREVLRLAPEYDGAHHNLGVALRRQGKLYQSVGSIRKAQRLGVSGARAAAKEDMQEQLRLNPRLRWVRAAIFLGVIVLLGLLLWLNRSGA